MHHLDTPPFHHAHLVISIPKIFFYQNSADENILLNFKNKEEFLAANKEEFRKTKKELITKNICYSENYDLVANDTDILCSERLKQAIEENGIIGFEFFEIDYEVVAE